MKLLYLIFVISIHTYGQNIMVGANGIYQNSTAKFHEIKDSILFLQYTNDYSNTNTINTYSNIYEVNKTTLYQTRSNTSNYVDTSCNYYRIKDTGNYIWISKFNPQGILQFSKKIEDSIQINYFTNYNLLNKLYYFDKNTGIYIYLPKDTLMKMDLSGNIVKKIKLNFTDTLKKILYKNSIFNTDYYTTSFFFNTDNYIILSSKYFLNDSFYYIFTIFDKSLNLIKRVRTDGNNFDFDFLNNSTIYHGLIDRNRYHNFSTANYILLFDTLFYNIKINHQRWGLFHNQEFLLERNSKLYYISSTPFDLSSFNVSNFLVRELDSNFNSIDSTAYAYYNSNSIFYLRGLVDKKKNFYYTYNTTQLNSYNKIGMISVDSPVVFPGVRYKACDSIYSFESTLTPLSDMSITICPNTHNVISSIEFMSISNTSVPFIKDNTFYPQGCLSAYFPPIKKDTFCINETLNLYSDTCVRHGMSTWKLSYPSDSDEMIDLKYENITFRQKGRVKIKHIHEIAGCIDSFSRYIVVLDSTNYQRLNLGKDTIVCSSNINIRLSAYDTTFNHYLWNTGSTDSVLYAIDTGIYSVQVSSYCGTLHDTIHIYKPKIPSTKMIGNDTIKICSQYLPYKYKINKLDSTYSYSWSHGIGADSTIFNSYGMYIVTASNPCFTIKDTIYINPSFTTVAIPPTTPDSVSLCANTYTIYRPAKLSLEVYQSQGGSWSPQDSIVLHKNEKILFRWTDSCGTKTIGSIKDVQRGSFTPIPLPKNNRICTTTPLQIWNTQSSVSQYEYLSGNWVLQNPIILKLGQNIVLRQDSCGNSVLDTFYGFTTFQKQTLFPKDTMIYCAQVFPVTLAAPRGYKTYAWSSGSTHDTAMVARGDVYTLTVSDTCYEYSDTMTVVEIPREPVFSLFSDTTIFCKKNLKDTLKAPTGYPKYIWDETLTTSLSYYKVDTTYSQMTLQIPRQCDTLRDTTRILWNEDPIAYPMFSTDTSYCDSLIGKIKMTLLNPQNYIHYLWYQFQDSPVVYVNTIEPSYFLANNRCQEIQVKLPVLYCDEPPIGIPSAFSPNGDGINDTWSLNGKQTNIIIHELAVYNKWGEKVYVSNQTSFNWNGMYKNEKVPNGVFLYYLDYEVLPQKIRKVYYGTVTVFW